MRRIVALGLMLVFSLSLSLPALAQDADQDKKEEQQDEKQSTGGQLSLGDAIREGEKVYGEFVSILRTIKDEASAEAAGEKLKELIGEFEELAERTAHFSEDELEDALQRSDRLRSLAEESERLMFNLMRDPAVGIALALAMGVDEESESVPSLFGSETAEGAEDRPDESLEQMMEELEELIGDEMSSGEVSGDEDSPVSEPEVDFGEIPTNPLDALPEALRECVIDKVGEVTADDFEVFLTEEFQKVMIDCALGQ